MPFLMQLLLEGSWDWLQPPTTLLWDKLLDDGWMIERMNGWSIVVWSSFYTKCFALNQTRWVFKPLATVCSIFVLPVRKRRRMRKMAGDHFGVSTYLYLQTCF